MSRKITVIGEYMIKFSEKDADAKRGFGSDTLNTSVHIARRIDPVALTAHYITMLGTDSLSQWMLDVWHGENIDISLTQRMGNRLPSLYYTETGSTGERTFYYWRSEAATKFWLESEQSAVICEELANFDYPCLSRVSLVILSPTSHERLLPLLRERRTDDEKVVFGNNCRLRPWASKEETQQIYQRIPECTGIAFLTLNGENALWGQQLVEDVIARTHNAGVKEVVVGRGADFCLVSITGEGLVNVPAAELPKEKVIDTTAADDSFSAGYLAAHLAGGSTGDATKRRYLTTNTVIQYRNAVILCEAMLA